MEESEIKNILVKHYAGSHSYGTNIETSDVDQRGIFCGDPVQLRTPFYRVNEQKIEGEDTSFYELANYCKLALENNPNVLETLWVDWGEIIFMTPVYGKLRENRHMFMSSKLAFTTTGYATAQLKRIKSREKHASHLPELNLLCEVLYQVLIEGAIDKNWINNHCGDKVYNYFLEKFEIEDSEMDYEVRHRVNSLRELAERVKKEKELTYEVLNTICKPKQTEFMSMVQNLRPEKILKFNFYDWQKNYQLVPFGNEIYGIYERQRKRTFTDTFEIVKFFNGKRDEYPKENLSFIVKFNEKQYKEAQHAYKMFWSWYENRNETRLEMEKEFGFDLKHAMHLVRLMRIGEEVLKTGQYNVKRADADELLSIRNGAWTFEETIKYAEEMDNLITKKLYKETHLPKTPDTHGVANLLMELQDMVWNKPKQLTF